MDIRIFCRSVFFFFFSIQVLLLTAQSSYIPNQVLIKWKAGNTFIQQENLKKTIGIRTLNDFPLLSIEVWDLSALSTSTQQFIEQYNNNTLLEFIEPNYTYHLGTAIPNDGYFNNLWGMHNTGQDGGTPDADIDAPEAWDIATGSPSMVVAIIDTGIDWAHPDLVDNMWQNLGEDVDGDGKILEWNGSTWIFDPGDENGVDDDGNGYIDDFVGWDFVNNDNNPFDDHFHGTHVAGTVGAKGNNNIGVSGVTWNVQLVALKFLTASGSGSTAGAIAAIEYAVNMGIPISNNSWGGGSPSTALYYAIENAANNNHLFLAAAGNNGVNNDNMPSYPSSYDLDNIIAVASTDRNDNRSDFSNYGAISVDLGAPGSSIFSCFPNNSYNTIGGTSMATPHVAGACALVWGSFPNKTYLEIKEAILNSVDVIPSMTGKTTSNGRLNLYNAMTYFGTPSVSCAYNDSLALVALYNSTNGANWTTTWNLNQPMDDWYGIQLNADRCVTCIDLDGGINCSGFWAINGNNLNGIIPSELGTLTALKHLSLGHNNISGTIPSELGNLSSLERLFLDNNNLTGSIPSGLGNFSNLKILDISLNPLTGTIPSELGNLNSIEFLWIAGTNINGNIGITGSIPSELGNLTTLTSLLLQSNYLSGSLPSELANLTNLQALYLNWNNLSGCFPPEYTTFCSIDYNFSNNLNLPSGGDFDAFCTNSTGSCSSSSCAFSDSLALVALYNSTNGANWTTTWNLNQPMDDWYGIQLNSDRCVTCIDLDGTVDCIPGIGNGNNLVGTIPSALGDLEMLSHLSLDYNDLSGSIPVALSNLIMLKDLELRHNDLSGNIPPELGDLTNLYNLFLNDNNLTGTIPLELSNLSNLIALLLHNNNLNGTIPSALGNLGNIKALILKDNLLTGSIPAELGNLANLGNLQLHANNLSGAIPPELGNLVNLINLQLSYNNLSGCFPSELATLCDVPSVDFSNNPNLPNSGDFAAFCTNNAGSCDADLVWPGDFNSDGIANNEDALYWGVMEGETGAIRPNATTNWLGQNCDDWSVAVNDINGKHQDGNGDGTVNSTDLQALIDNYGQVHATALNTTNAGNANYYLEPIGYTNTSPPSVYSYYLHIEDNNGNYISKHGLACSIDLSDMPVIDANIDVTNSSLVPSHTIDNYNSITKILDIALTRTDNVNKLCNGAIAQIDVIVDDNIISTAPVNIQIYDGHSMENDGTILLEGSGAISHSINDNPGSSSVTPKITASIEHEQCNQLGSVELSINGGTAPYSIQWNNNETSPQIYDLLAGEYIVTVTDYNGVSSFVTLEVEGNYTPIYDENGNPILCDNNADCPSTRSVNGSISTGTHQAYKHVLSNGTVQNGTNATFKAGQTILLEAGFCVESGATFSVELEDCSQN